VKQPDFCIGSVLKLTGSVFARNFFDLAGIAAMAVVPGLIAPARDGYAPINLGLPAWAGISIYVTSNLLGQSIMCLVVFQRMRGRPISLSEGVKAALHRSWLLVGIAFLILFTIGILQSRSQSYVAGVFAGGIFLPIWVMALPVCAIEGLGPLRSFGRSWALSKGHRGKMLVLLLLGFAALFGLLETMRFLVRAILSFAPSGLIGPIARIDQLTWTAVWTVFFAILLAVSYHELRVAKGSNQADRLVEVFE